MTRPRDTSEAAWARQLELYRQMTPAQKFAIAIDLTSVVRELACSGIRMRHPEYTDDEVRRALAALIYGREVAERLWPGCEIPRP